MRAEQEEEKNAAVKSALAKYLIARPKTTTGYSPAHVAIQVKVDPVMAAFLLKEMAMDGVVKRNKNGYYSHVLAKVK